jgi:hypothetical protein
MSIPLDHAVKSYVILLDTCFAMHGGFKVFLQRYENELKTNPIKCPTIIVKELEHLAKQTNRLSNDGSNTSELTKKAIGRINKAAQKGLIQFVGDNLDANTPKIIGAADAVFVSRVNQILLNKPVLMLTRDNNLAKQLESLTQTGNYALKNLLIYGTKKTSASHSNQANSKVTQLSKKTPSMSSRLHPSYSVSKPFNVTQHIVPNQDSPIHIRETIKEGSTLKTQGGQSIILRKVLSCVKC